jgi:hypothetical protein
MPRRRSHRFNAFILFAGRRKCTAYKLDHQTLPSRRRAGLVFRYKISPGLSLRNHELWGRPAAPSDVEINIEYREALPNDPNATTSKAGETVYSHEWPILFAKIDPGKDNAATFYVYNESTFFAFVSPPRTASYVPLGQTAAREAAVSLIGMTAGMSLFPVERTPAR